MQHTVKVIPQWREPARTVRHQTGRYIELVGGSHSTAIPYITDGSDETYQAVIPDEGGSHYGIAYAINKNEFANQIVAALPNNAKHIIVELRARSMTDNMSNAIYYIHNLTMPTGSTSGRYDYETLYTKRPHAENVIQNPIAYHAVFGSKSEVLSYFSNLTYDDIVLQQRMTAVGSFLRLYDTWLEITYSLPQVKIKAEGEWTDGEIKAKVNGEWVDAESVHVKVAGAWIEVN